MRTILWIVATMLVVPTPVLAATFTSHEAAAHVGETVTIEGVVSSVFTLKSSGTILLDIGGDYPKNEFSAVIFSDAAGEFPDAAGLSGKTVDVTGPISLYRGKPEIVLKTGDQLQAK